MLEIILNALIISMSLLLLWFVFAPKKWKHDHVRWGYPKKDVTVSSLPGASGESECRFCDQPIIKDRGGWYHPSDYSFNPPPKP